MFSIIQQKKRLQGNKDNTTLFSFVLKIIVIKFAKSICETFKNAQEEEKVSKFTF